MTYTPKKGDRVRITFEAELREAGPWLSGRDFAILQSRAENLTVEKIEPPAVQFQPGDVVRGKDSGFLYALGITGYTNVGGTNPGATFAYDPTVRLDYFTSRNFEKININ